MLRHLYIFLRECKDSMEKSKLTNLLEGLLDLCLHEFEVSKEEVKSVSQDRYVVDCRKTYCILAHEFFQVKYETIGRVVNRTRVTVGDYITNPPDSRYSKMCLKEVRDKYEKENRKDENCT